MPRRGGGGSMRSASPRPSAPVRSRATSPPPATRQPQAPAAAPPAAGAAPQGPGLMGQMMATAGGVAIGSAVGHSIGNMMSGGGGGAGGDADTQQQDAGQVQSQQPVNYAQHPGQQPCEFEIRQFMECTQNQSDISLCQGFNEALKQCKARYGNV